MVVKYGIVCTWYIHIIFLEILRRKVRLFLQRSRKQSGKLSLVSKLDYFNGLVIYRYIVQLVFASLLLGVAS